MSPCSAQQKDASILFPGADFCRLPPDSDDLSYGLNPAGLFKTSCCEGETGERCFRTPEENP